MKTNLLYLLLLLMSSSFCGFAASGGQKSSGWKPLFGKNLSLAKFDKNVWRMADGTLTASEDKNIWTVSEYENFVLDLEFKTADETNSGVFVYCSDPVNWTANSVEIQIADDYCKKWGTARKDYQCGAIFGHLPASEQKVVKKPGEWNRMVITCKGQMIEVVLNGKNITKIDMSKWTSGKTNPDGSVIPAWLPKPLSELPTKGIIGLQGKHANASIWFRNVRIKNL